MVQLNQLDSCFAIITLTSFARDSGLPFQLSTKHFHVCARPGRHPGSSSSWSKYFDIPRMMYYLEREPQFYCNLLATFTMRTPDSSCTRSYVPCDPSLMTSRLLVRRDGLNGVAFMVS